MKIAFERHKLKNGLTVIIHEDHDTDMVAVNTLYRVGARNETSEKTGFAHLFEHLMFGGSKNIPHFDGPVQQVGGENNAFTSNDLTNYYITLPAANIETALWLESDRMLELAFTDKSLEVQRSVVIEEFKQRYLNQPYGDVWLLLRPLVYTTHPYRWSTIGKEISHIEEATMEDVKSFFYKYYRPNNAILAIGGNVHANEVLNQVEKWYADIPAGDVHQSNIPVEPAQTERRFLEVERNVPQDAIYMAFKMDARLSDLYYTCDLISDILGRGKSSRLYQSLVKANPVFTEISAYLTGDLDPGMLVISGRIKSGYTHEQAESSIWEVINDFVAQGVSDQELKKVKNKVESAYLFELTGVLEKTMNLAIMEFYDRAELLNEELPGYRSVTKENMKLKAADLFKQEKASVMYYKSSKQ